MKSVSGKHFCRVLEEKGWELKRIHGSHHIYAKSGYSARISVPVHGNAPLKIGLQIHLMKLAGIDESDLWSLFFDFQRRMSNMKGFSGLSDTLDT